ncbi:MAG: sulfatase [Planctomycetota bacterium]
MKLAGLCLVVLGLVPHAYADRPNVLLVFVDDLKPMTRDYGQQHMATPNFDRLAAGGLRFENAYCQVPTCGASRASLMTSLYPTVERFPNFKCFAEKDAAGAPTLPQRFKQAGYVTVSNGKVFHHQGDTQDRSWSEPAWRPSIGGRTHYNDETTEFLSKSKRAERRANGKLRKKTLMFEKGNTPAMETHDGLIAAKTLADLERLAGGDRPFFLACGFAKPHMPFFSPAATWAPYPLRGIDLATHRQRPIGFPLASRPVKEQFAYVPMTHNLSRELRYNSDPYHRHMRQGYYASVTHADDLLGRLLDKVDELGLRDNTLVLVLGDHGWLLGEHNEWAKNQLLHEALRTAFWMQGPGVAEGAAAETFVEFADIYPTLCELAGIEVEPRSINGRSFAAVLNEPATKHRTGAYTRFEQGDVLTTADHFFGVWQSEQHGEEVLLIDRKADPLGVKNVAADAAYGDMVSELKGQLRQRIQSARSVGPQG